MKKVTIKNQKNFVCSFAKIFTYSRPKRE